MARASASARRSSGHAADSSWGCRNPFETAPHPSLVGTPAGSWLRIGPAPFMFPAPQAALAQPVEQRIRNAWVGCSSHPGGTSLAKQGNTGRRGPHSRELRRLKAAVARDKEDELRIPIHRQGWPFIVLGVGFNALLILWLGWWGLVATPVVLWIISFFRDPDRAPPLGERFIGSAADGILLPVGQAPPPPALGVGPEVRPR